MAIKRIRTPTKSEVVAIVIVGLTLLTSCSSTDGVSHRPDGLCKYTHAERIFGGKFDSSSEIDTCPKTKGR